MPGKKFKPKPIEHTFEAVQWDGTEESTKDVLEWMMENKCIGRYNPMYNTIDFLGLSANLTSAQVGGYICLEADGQFNAIGEDALAQYFEEVKDGSAGQDGEGAEAEGPA